MPRYFYDDHRIRYQLLTTNEGHPFNWLFIPGGPGADSRYLHTLITLLQLPGNTWLIDLPGTGDNIKDIALDYDFNTWFDLFVPMIEQFQNPVLVGHSFGGMFPLLFPDLEQLLKGFIILNSSPSLWLEEAVFYAQNYKMPDLSKEMLDFTQNPCEQTFRTALQACIPYYFPLHSREKGSAILEHLPFPFPPAVWWQKKACELNFSATWIPKQVPTLIIGGSYDFSATSVSNDSILKWPKSKKAGICHGLKSLKRSKTSFILFLKNSQIGRSNKGCILI
jgi:pimeloyl-ACP methyl ester carboxylesterase